MRNILLLICVSLTGCAPDREVVQLLKGDRGSSCSTSQQLDTDGNVVGAKITCEDGSYSVVLNGSDGISCSVSKEDDLNRSIIKCGESTVEVNDGQPAISSIVSYTSSGCSKIGDNNVYVSVSNSNSSLYSSSNCHPNTKLAQISQGESYWVSDRVLSVHQSGGLRVINFN